MHRLFHCVYAHCYTGVVSRIANLSIRVLLPAAAALTVVSVLVVEQIHIDHDLQLILPPSVQPGTRLPVRALLFGQLRSIKGPRLLTAPVRVALLNDKGREVSAARLRPSYADTMEATLPVPRSLRGPATVRAVAALSDGELVGRAPLQVRVDAPKMRPTGRPLGALQGFSAGPIRPEPDSTVDAPSAMQVRIVGGACVPEQRCDILVLVGAPAAAIQAQSSAAVTPLGSGAKPSRETEGIVALSVVTHGPEAELQLQATRSGLLVARRSIRLPIALAATSLRLPGSIIAKAAQASFRLEDNDEGAACLLDAFYEDRWWLANSHSDCASNPPLPLHELRPGVWRVQARRDPFSADTAGVRLFYLRRSGQSDADALRAVARYAIARDPLDSYARQVAARPAVSAAQDLQTQAAFLLAEQERDLIPQPSPVTSHARTQARLQQQRIRLRRFSLAALALAGVCLGLLILRRGLRAASKARHIMAAAGDSSAQSRRMQLRMALSVLAAVAALALAFVAIAMYVIARSEAPGILM